MTTTRQLFGHHSLRCTQQRMAVYEALRRSKDHPTAEELFRIVKPRVDRLSLATVYNSLEVLCKAGLIRRVPMSNGCCRYDSDTSVHLHVRFPETAEIENVPEALSEKLFDNLPMHVVNEIGETLGVKIESMSVQILATRNPSEDNGSESHPAISDDSEA